jgi:formyltetrahydrofolate deformylase
VQCPDQKGVIAALATLLAGYNCNVLASDQFTDIDSYREDGSGGSGAKGSNGSSTDNNSSGAPRFFQRIHFDFTDLSVGLSNLDVLEKAISGVAERYDMQFRLAVNSGSDPRKKDGGSSGAAPTLLKKKCVILVSKLDHCLYDLLIRAKNGELPMEVPVVASNHPDLEPVARMFGVDFEHVPIGASAGAAADVRAAAKKTHEARLTSIIDEAGADLVVLARYMQIMSSEFCEANWRRTVNIHHSFLPLSFFFVIALFFSLRESVRAPQNSIDIGLSSRAPLDLILVPRTQSHAAAAAAGRSRKRRRHADKQTPPPPQNKPPDDNKKQQTAPSRAPGPTTAPTLGA